MEIKEKLESKKEPKLVLGAVRCLDYVMVMAAWDLIRPEVEKIADRSMDEYKAVDVWRAIFSGQTILYVAYMDQEGQVPDNGSEAYVAMKLLGEPTKDYVGFVLVRVDQTSVHIWQAYITPEFQKTNCLEVGLEFVASEARKMGAPYLSFSSVRSGWSLMAPKLGFEPTFTLYRKSLKE